MKRWIGVLVLAVISVTPDCVNTVSKLEFEQMTDSIDKRAFKRKLMADKLTKSQ